MTIGMVGTDARSLIQQELQQWGLGSLTNWAWNQITAGASADQVTLDLYQTPQFKQRFPGIAERQAKGLPPISPADYISYEDQLAQIQSQYALPPGFLTDPKTVGQMIGNDVSVSEVQDRVEKGYSAVATAPPEVRQAFTAMFGPAGNGALAAHFLDPTRATPILEQQATAAQLSGIAGMGSVNISTDDAMKLAQMGVTASAGQQAVTQLEQAAPLYQESITDQSDLSAGKEGIEAEFGTSQQATQAVQRRKEQRTAAFAGGGSPTADQYGVEGAGAANAS